MQQGPEPKDTSPHRYGLADPDPYYAYYNYTLYWCIMFLFRTLSPPEVTQSRSVAPRFRAWSKGAIMRHATLLALLTTLQIADIATTKVAVARGNLELNPIASLAFGASGILTAALLFKLALMLWAVMLAALVRRARPVLMSAIVVYSLVVINNLTVVFT